LVGHGGDLGRVGEQPGDERPPRLRQVVVGAGFEERVVVPLEQRQVGVHAGPWVLGERLGHEGRVDALAERDLLDHHPERHDVVGRAQRVGVAQVDLLLAGPALVVAELHGDAHRLEHGDRLAAEVVRDAVRRVVEVPAAVDRLRDHSVNGAVLEQVELDLRVCIEREALVGGPAERALQHESRVGIGR
jgi:hypothetical protein